MSTDTAIPSDDYHDSSSANGLLGAARRCIKVFHLNTRSIRHKTDKILSIFSSLTFSFDLLLFSETWLTVGEDPPYFENYTYNGIVRPVGRGGGVAIYVKQSLKHEVVPQFSLVNEVVECLMVRLEKAFAVIVYRPPSGCKTKFISFIEDVFEYLCPTGFPFVIMGDVNIDMLSQDATSRQLIALANSFACNNVISKATRLTAETATLLDICLTNTLPTSCVAGSLAVDISDHLPISCTIPSSNGTCKSNKKVRSRQINADTLGIFRYRVIATDWNHVLQERDANLAYKLFINKLIKCYDEAFPVSVKNAKRQKIRKPWISNALFKKITKKNNMYHAFIKTRDIKLLSEFKKYRNHLNGEIRRAKFRYYENLFSRISDNPSKIWSEVRNLSGQIKQSHIPRVLENSSGLGNREVATAMNNYFIKSCDFDDAGYDEDTQLPVNDRRLSNSIVLHTISCHETEELITKIKNNCAAGYDDIKAIPIKYVADVISPALSHIINLTLVTGVFPDELKIARVCPVFKGGNDQEIGNYRPISVLPILSKVFESAINIRLQKFFAKYNVISDAQFGFQKCKSTELALLNIKNEILTNFEKKLYTLGLFVDFRKAFDTVHHSVLLEKLNNYGVRGVANRLIQNYLTDRYQYVAINQETSPRARVNKGVPQGSILGPLLFIVYVNNLCSIPDSPKLIMYADDTNIFFAGSSISQLEKSVNTYLNKLSSWIKLNKLRLNASKTKYILFAPINKPRNISLSVSFEGQTLEQVKVQKFLGVWFQEDLSWNEHINKLAADLSRSVGCMYKLCPLLPLWLKKALYYTLIYSRLSYCVLCWGTTTAQNYKTLLTLQKKVLRLFEGYYGMPQGLSARPLFPKYLILQANQIYYYKLLLYIQNNKLYPMYDSSRCAEYYLRTHSIRTPKTRTTYGQQHIDYQIPSLLNKLGDVLDLNKKTSKNKFKEFLLYNCIEYT